MNELTIAQILSAVWRQRFKVSLTFLMVLALTVSAFIYWPRMYGSEGRLFVQLGRNNTGMDPTGGSRTVSIQDSRETEIRSVAEIAGSRAVIEAVVDKIGPERLLRKDRLLSVNPLGWLTGLVPNRESDSEDALSGEEHKQLRVREKAVKSLEDNLSIRAEKKTSVISLYVKAKSSKLAQEIVDTLMQCTREKHLEVHALKGSTEFFEREYQKHENVLDQAIRDQSLFRTERGILSIEGARGTLQQILSRLENDVITAEVELAQADERVRQFKAELSEIDVTIEVPIAGRERLSFEDAQTELYRLRNERARKAVTLSDRNPAIVQLDRAIRSAEESLKQMQSDRTESARQLNPVYENLKTELVKAIVDRDAASGRLANLKTKLNEANDRLKEINDSQSLAEQHQRQVDIARQYLSTYATKRGESKVLDQLDRQSISDVVVAQSATFVIKHVSPRGSLVFLIGGLLACVAALATAMFFERDRLLAPNQEEDVEQAFDLPVLVNLPRVPSHRQVLS